MLPPVDVWISAEDLPAVRIGQSRSPDGVETLEVTVVDIARC